MAHLTVLLLALVLASAQIARAGLPYFFIVNCAPLVDVRLDPIVNPGNLSSHVHAVFGSVNFGPNVTTADLTSGNTTCRISQDRSMYWAPSLFFRAPNNTYHLVKSGFKAYYFNRGRTADFRPIPLGLRMLVGAATNKVQPPTVNDTIPHWVCFSYVANGAAGNGSYTAFPPLICGVWQARIMFPNCWDGRNLDSLDHKSHMAYRNASDYCPPTHPVRLPQVFFEVDYNVGSVKGPNGTAVSPSDFVLATGDKKGVSAHADFLSGWNTTLLQAAITTCVNNQQDDPACALNKFNATRTVSYAPVKRNTSFPTEAVTNLNGGILLSGLLANISDVPVLKV